MDVLSEDDIRKLVAGPETDALVAEKVMGWHKFKHLDAVIAGSEESWVDSKDIWRRAVEYWVPSTDINDAWNVVGKMLLENLYLSLTARSMLGIVSWAASFNLKNSSLYYLIAIADSASLAICKAALLARIKKA